MNVDTEKDVLYDSLTELRKKCPKFQRKIHKQARNKETDKQITKQLTCVLNNLFYTNGKSKENDENVSEIQDYHEIKKTLYTKYVCKTYEEKVITQSDVITIDIDPQSTFLPLMCKLIIICEGAIIERGKCLLVRDVSTQVTQNEIISKSKRNPSSSRSIQTDEVHETLSEDNIRRDLLNVKEDINRNFSKSTNTENYLSNKHKNSMYGSHHDVNEYWSIPYYQYQKKNFNKKDFTINTSVNDLNNYTLDVVNEHSRSRIPSYRNEMYMIVNDDDRHSSHSGSYYDQSDFYQSNRSIYQNESYQIKRSYMQERFSCFEAEVIISDDLNFGEQIFPLSNSSNYYHIEEIKNTNVFDPNEIKIKLDESQDKRRSHRSSVTNLVMMQVKNGRIV